MPTARRRALLPLLALGAASQLTACGLFVAQSYALQSATTGARLQPTLPTAIFIDDDGVTAEVILTDLPTSLLRPGASLEGASGNLIHIRLFMRPRPGRTPIESTAFNTAVTHAVIADGRVGIYRGGGFMLPRTGLGGSRFAARFLGGQVRLESSTGGFLDLLETSDIRAGVNARRDPGLLQLALARLRELVDETDPVDPAIVPPIAQAR